ncbi:unnamed protein product [Acanthosepion pharaonis]|uniref:Uncharacterized protein n=1 Tax=Acanthosepion pharaonis TaxID=158019 RepID=A0A812CK46_ACAPH|nr:unnamed protein product [Sepia pharaonis]
MCRQFICSCVSITFPHYPLVCLLKRHFLNSLTTRSLRFILSFSLSLSVCLSLSLYIYNLCNLSIYSSIYLSIYFKEKQTNLRTILSPFPFILSFFLSFLCLSKFIFVYASPFLCHHFFGTVFRSHISFPNFIIHSTSFLLICFLNIYSLYIFSFFLLFLVLLFLFTLLHIIFFPFSSSFKLYFRLFFFQSFSVICRSFCHLISSYDFHLLLNSFTCLVFFVIFLCFSLIETFINIFAN